ncbi:hypothetical protein GX50_03200 [[Emmonsia] crescens]|uniref:Uncharacterized protein n=1 Tax=[Emmonsia] crescens TaxID=73230 RepID=A0A2B7ZLA6_9EURO|nr:hypothetical protein GX50_03200 [Emmonsia crescens]
MAPPTKVARTPSRTTFGPLPPRSLCPNGAALEEVVPDQHNTGRSRIRKFMVVPGSLIMHAISQLPCLRRVLWRRTGRTHEYNVRPVQAAHQRDAALIQTRGQMVHAGDDMCTGCQQGYGPFTTCVVAMTSSGEYPRFGACANCVWRGLARECTQCQSFNVDIDESDGEWVYESEDEDEDEESFLPSPPPSPNSRHKTPQRNNVSQKPSKSVSTLNSRITRSKRTPRGQSTAPKASRSLSPAVVIPSPSRRTSTCRKYFKIPPGLSPNTAEDIRNAINELNSVRAKLCSRLELLESVELGGWE